MSRITRRRFVKRAAAASAVFPTFTIAGTKASGKVLGANDTIRVGVAGINGRGKSHIKGFAEQSKVDVVCLIDPDSRLFEARRKLVQSHGGNRPVCVQDVRHALDDDNIDVISIATCNHWHSLMTVWACQAEKDVYVEKPISHNVWEGRKCVEAARRHRCVVQHGTQQRSRLDRAQQIAAIQSGKYGKLLVSKGYCCKKRWSIGVKDTRTPPAGLDFNVWLGPAPEQSFHDNLVHYNWHWFWDFGNGDTGNQGVHEMDVARWAIKDSTLPQRVWSLGGRFAYKDQGETPNTQLAVYDYGETLLVFETRGLVEQFGAPKRVENEFYTDEGVIKGESRGAPWEFFPKNGGPPQPLEGDESATVVAGGTFGSFIQSVRERRVEDNNANAEVAHYSAALCHLGNISYRLGQTVPFSQSTHALGDNREVVESFRNIHENLTTVGVKLEETDYRMGRVLNMDPKLERFVDDEEANQLLSRDYREPFVMPDVV